ncbi:Aspartate--tRNA ligase [compost metagenome]
MRIYKRDIQEKMFKAIGLSMEEAQDKFGYLLDAFEYGTPPHGGIAFGFDRLVMLLSGRSNLRETIAFPKTASATDLLMNAPSEVDAPQLEQLHIKLAKKPVEEKK